jgi:hypothetical protein
MCRKKKIKCDGKMPACTHCINYKTECIFTQVEKKRNPPKGYAKMPHLGLLAGTDLCLGRNISKDSRIGWVEWRVSLNCLVSLHTNFLETANFTVVQLNTYLFLGLLNEDDNGRTDLGTLEKRLAEKNNSRRPSQVPGSNPTSPSQSTPNEDPGSTPRSTLASPEPQSKNGDKRHSTVEPERPPEEVEELSDMMCSLVTNNCGETRYIGTGSYIMRDTEILT